jgi:predicted nucleic acid-binding protein
MARIVFDTSVLFAYMFKEPSFEEVKVRINRIAEGEDAGLISAVTVAELFERITRTGGKDIALKTLERIKMSGFVVMDVTEEIAKLAGPLKAKFPHLSTADAIIMSTAYANDAKLFTFDKGFYGIGGVDVIGI